jgi:hypothetical protein
MLKAEYWFQHPSFPEGGKWMDRWPGNIVIMGTQAFCEQSLRDTGFGGSVGIDGSPTQIRFVEVPDMPAVTSSRNSNSSTESSSR